MDTPVFALLLLDGGMSLSKSLLFSEPQFLHLQYGVANPHWSAVRADQEQMGSHCANLCAHNEVVLGVDNLA